MDLKREHELGQTAEARKRTDRDLRCIGWGLVLLGVLMPALVTVENTGIYRTLMNGIYQGQEIGMTNFDFPDMQKVRDVESINIWNIGKRLHLPRSLRWRMIKTKSRDNARTPMQWNDSPNAGFTTGTPWLSVNGNYPRINVAEQENAPNSVLAYYRQLIAFRNGSEILQAGDFSELYRKDGVYAYRRSLNVESIIVVISLSTKERPNPVSGTVVLSNYGRQESPACLSPYEALILREV